jgi:ribosomal protein S18 acetylase RimI-like enzyme
MTSPARSIEVLAADAATQELVEAFARLLPQLSTSAAPVTLKSLAAVIDAPTNAVLIARDLSAGGQIVGTLTLVTFCIPTAVRAWIEDVVVDGGARGLGVGEALVKAAVSLGTQRGARTIDLTSRQSRRAAHRLYEKVGFHVRDTSVYRYGPKPAV